MPMINLEDYSFASKGKTFHIAENMGLLKYKFYKSDIPYQLIVPPQSRNLQQEREMRTKR